MTANEHRLPATVRPVKYALTLRPDLEAFTFAGEEEVAIRVVEPVESFALHATELAVSEATIRLPNGTSMSARIELDEAAQRLALTFPQAIPAGGAILSLRFTGILNDRMAGFYRSRYAMADGREGWMASTQFESTDARRAFPCWDEPAAKATFDLTLVVPKDLAAVSNTPIVEEEDLGDGTKRVRFAETPLMSTYLLAFVVGPLEAVRTEAPGGTTVGVWATPDKIAYGKWALENGVRILDYLNDYYGVVYPLPKLDHLAIPDFAAGAMENWGAITYRERLLLLDPATSSSQTRQNVVDVMAHETAHMWFGDLVTMAWWDDLWLNESFASWMGTKTVDAIHPDWQMWTQFLYADTVHGLDLDALRNSHPIEVEVKDPAEIREIFDAVSYSKGAATLWMLEQFLGEDVFRQGLRDYVAKHAYGNARTEDLWDALEAASGQPVRALMGTWVKQTGFPLLHVDVTRTGGEVQLALTQARFLEEHILGTDEDPTLWTVPVRVARAGAAEPEAFLLEGRSTTRSLPDADWVKVNAGQSGFYRVNYPPEEWTRLRRAVEAHELGPRDRLGLLDDAYALARAGYLPATTFLDLASAYAGEDDATVWRTIAESLAGFETLIADEPFLGGFDAYGRRLFQPIGGRVGWDPKPGEGHLNALRRTTVLARLGHYGDPAVLEEASGRFAQFLKDPTTLHPDLRGVVYGLVAQTADEDTYETLWDLERKATSSEEKVRLLVALTRPRRERLLRKTLERSLTDEVRSQDTVIVVTSLAAARPRIGRDLGWSFVTENWDEMYRRYAASGFPLRRLVQIAEAFTTEERAAEVEAFFEAHAAPEVKRTVRQCAERIRVNAVWRERNGEALAQWFRERDDA